jgi:hypothetical protein
MLNDLSYCQPRVSCIIDAEIEDAWSIIRDWGTMPWLDKVKLPTNILTRHSG